MKKLTIFALISIMIAGSVFAQPIREQREAAPQLRGEQQREAAPQARGERQREAVPQVRGERQREAAPQARGEQQREIPKITVVGTLKLDKGLIAIESGNTVYRVPMLNRFIGFISGLREGSNVSVEGFQFRNMLQPTKVTIDGQTYDFARIMQNARFGFGNDNRNMGNYHHFDNQKQNRQNFGQNRHAPNQRNRSHSCNCCR